MAMCKLLTSVPFKGLRDS